jgi:hypothetical protein
MKYTTVIVLSKIFALIILMFKVGRRDRLFELRVLISDYSDERVIQNTRTKMCVII